MRNLVDLASRRGGGIEVALIWDRSDRTLVVFARDDRTDEEVAIPVTGDEASEVYRHPFAYAHRAIDDAAPSRRALPHAR
jgi:serine/threonine protein kinase HipA of HipAB toxin-antitoxin module